MEHQRYTERFEASSGHFGPLRGGRRRQRLADDVREADAAALEQSAVLDDARQPAAAELRVGGLFPHIVPERLAVQPFERVDDALLQARADTRERFDCRRTRRSRKMALDKAQHRVVPRDDIARLQDPVILVGEDQHLRRHAVILQRFEQVETFADRAAVVVLAMDDQRRRLPLLDVADRRVAVELRQDRRMGLRRPFRGTTRPDDRSCR